MGVSLINDSNKGVKRAELRRHTVKHKVAVREANNQAAARNDLRLTSVNVGHARPYKQFLVC